MAGMRRYRRFLLLVVLPLVALIAGLTFYLNGGRYVTTDDAYVGAQKVLITPDISGKIEKVVVKEGQQVNEGDVLFEIDPVPFRLAVAQAKATLDQAKVTYDNLVANIKIYGQMVDLAQQGIDLKQRDVDRKSALVKNNVGSQLDLDNSATALVTASAQTEFVRAAALQRQDAIARQSRTADRGIPALCPGQGGARPGRAQSRPHRDARADGRASRRRSTRSSSAASSWPARRCSASSTSSNPWVDANPKESDFTYVAVGQPVTLDVDAFPNHVFKGTVGSLSPGTGAQFAILPPQNATGNFVKVVQRVPVRIYFDKNDKFVRKLKAGMSVYATIDTNHRRSLAALLGFSPAVANQDRTSLTMPTPGPSPSAVPGLRRNMVTICAMTATIMQALDTTIANVALPYMQGTLSASQDQINWVLTSYIVAAAIMTAPVGWIANRFGRKRIFIICSGGFTIASVLCGLAQDINQMVLFRLLQGVFGAALVPLSQAVMLDSYALHERAKAMSIWGMGVMMGPIMGPSLGAWLTETYSWHWVFFVNLPFGIFTVLGLMIFMDETKKNLDLRFDWFGFTALAIGIGSLQLALDRGEQLGWLESNEIIAEFIISAVGFYYFFAHSLTTSKPFIQFALFKDKNFVGGCVFMAVMGLVLYLDHGAVVAVPAERDRLSHHHRGRAAGEPRLRHLRRHDAGRPHDAVYRGAHADHLPASA